MQKQQDKITAAEEKEYMTIGGREFEIIGYNEDFELPYRAVPLVNIPIMSDERWIELSKQNASKRLLEWGILPTEKNIARFHAALRLSVEFPMNLEEIRQLVLNCESISPLSTD